MKRYETGNLRFWTEEERDKMQIVLGKLGYLARTAEQIAVNGEVANMVTFHEWLREIEKELVALYINKDGAE